MRRDQVLVGITHRQVGADSGSFGDYRAPVFYRRYFPHWIHRQILGALHLLTVIDPLRVIGLSQFFQQPMHDAAAIVGWYRK